MIKQSEFNEAFAQGFIDKIAAIVGAGSPLTARLKALAPARAAAPTTETIGGHKLLTTDSKMSRPIKPTRQKIDLETGKRQDVE